MKKVGGYMEIFVGLFLILLGITLISARMKKELRRVKSQKVQLDDNNDKYRVFHASNGDVKVWETGKIFIDDYDMRIKSNFMYNEVIELKVKSDFSSATYSGFSFMGGKEFSQLSSGNIKLKTIYSVVFEFSNFERPVIVLTFKGDSVKNQMIPLLSTLKLIERRINKEE